MKTKVLFCFLLLAFVAAFGAGSTVSVVTLLCPGDTNSHARAYPPRKLSYLNVYTGLDWVTLQPDSYLVAGHTNVLEQRYDSYDPTADEVSVRYADRCELHGFIPDSISLPVISGQVHGSNQWNVLRFLFYGIGWNNGSYGLTNTVTVTEGKVGGAFYVAPTAPYNGDPARLFINRYAEFDPIHNYNGPLVTPVTPPIITVPPLSTPPYSGRGGFLSISCIESDVSSLTVHSSSNLTDWTYETNTIPDESGSAEVSDLTTEGWNVFYKVTYYTNAP